MPYRVTGGTFRDCRDIRSCFDVRSVDGKRIAASGIAGDKGSREGSGNRAGLAPIFQEISAELHELNAPRG